MTIDKAQLKALAEAATPGRNFDRLPEAGGGLKYECTGDEGSLVLKVDHKNDEWGFVGDNGEADEAFFLACTPATVLELLSEIEQLQQFKAAYTEWSDKTEWVQESAHWSELGKHRADVLKLRVDQLKAENEALRGVMATVVSEIPHAKHIQPGNAPGHSHRVPGVWDEDNGAKAGKECGWCKVWNTALSMSKEARHD